MYTRIPYKVIVTAFLLSFAMWAPMMCVPPMEHILKRELAMTHAEASLLFSIPILMTAVVALPAGHIADPIGIKRAAGIGAILLAVGAVLRGTATDATSLLAFTFIYGTGFGWSFVTVPKLASVWAPPERSGVLTGILAAGMPIGISIGLAFTMPVLFPMAGTVQGVFFMWSIAPTIAAVAWWVLVREPEHSHVNMAQMDGSAYRFRRVFRNRNLWLICILFFLQNFFVITWLGWAPTLMILKGMAPSLAGLAASTTTWAIIPTFFFIPSLAHSLGLRKIFVWVPSVILAAAMYAVIHISLSMIWPLMALVGIAIGTRFITLLALPVETMPEADAGTATGLMLSIGFIGGVIGPLISGHILDLTGNLRLALFLLIGMSIACAGIALRLPDALAQPQVAANRDWQE